MDTVIEEWDGIRPVIFKDMTNLDLNLNIDAIGVPGAIYRPAVTTWDGVKFYLMVGIVDGQVLIYAGADGSEEVRNKYKLKVSLDNPQAGNKRWEVVSVSELVPLDMIYEKNEVGDSGFVGFVPERLMQRYFYKEKEGNVMFGVKFKIKKW